MNAKPTSNAGETVARAANKSVSKRAIVHLRVDRRIIAARPIYGAMQQITNSTNAIGIAFFARVNSR